MLPPSEAEQGCESTRPSVPSLAAERTRVEPETVAPTHSHHMPGDFVSAQYESDCERFVAEAIRLARCRAENLGRPSSMI
jgi:hypothetical protein